MDTCCTPLALNTLAHYPSFLLFPLFFSFSHTTPPLSETTRDEMEGMFNKLLQRGDVGLIIINQPIADQIRPVIAAHTDTIPMVLEVPASGGSTGPASLKKDPVW